MEQDCFDEYIRQGEPSQREAAYAWSTAIGRQAVNGFKTSEYLLTTKGLALYHNLIQQIKHIKK